MHSLVAEREPNAGRSQPQHLVRSVLFSDVVASTELIDHQGEDVWLNLVDRHARMVCALAHGNGGDVVTFLGDGFMLMFDDPSDALTCAIRMQTASLVQGLMRIRIGLDHGDVFRYRQDWFVGRTIHVAARLSDLCDENEIIVSRRCMRQARLGVAAPVSETRSLPIRGLRAPFDVHVLRAGENA